MKRLRLPTLIALLVAGLWGAGLGAMHLRGDMRLLERIEATMTDLRSILLGGKPPPDIVTIIAIDDAIVQQEHSYPLPRATLARIIDAIAPLRPKVVALDVLLLDPGADEEGDRMLAEALRREKSVIAAAAVFSTSEQEVPGNDGGALAHLPEAGQFLLPLTPFSNAAAIGIVNVTTDKTGTPRFMPMLFKSGNRIESSFPLRVAALAAGTDPGIEPGGLTLDGRPIRTDIGHVLPLTFYGPRGTIRTISAASVLNGQIPADAIKDHIVVIGATVTGGGDVFPTPFDPVLPGVEVISTAITHLMADDGIIRDRSVRLVDFGIAVVLPMILVGLVAWRRSTIGLTAIVLVLVIWAEANIRAFSNGIWLSAALPMAAAIPPAVLFGATQLWLDRRRASRFARQSELLQRVQAPGLSDWLVRNPGFLTEPVRQDAAVVFIDLSGFTGLSESLGPAAIREVLNDFYALVDEEATASGGIITSFMGDGAMILFGLPQPARDDAFRGCACAIRLCDRTRDWLAALPDTTAARIGFKIGAHFGTVVASRLGGAGHQQITATGDTVNVASRLMEVAARNGVELVISDELLKAAGQDSAPYHQGTLQGPLETKIRGRSGSMIVYLWRQAS